MATVTKPIALDESFNTTEVTPRNIADVLAEGLSHITGRTASEVEYDNTDSGLTADNVQDALDEINGKISTVPSVDIQTAVDEFSTYNGGILDSLKVALTPNQDLHGYDSPWVGGAGKNKLPLPIAETKNGITLTRNADGSVTLTGTSTNITYFDFFAGNFDTETYAGYIFRANSTNSSWGPDAIEFRISTSSKVSLQSFFGNNNYAIDNNGSGLYFAIRITANYSIPSGGVTIYPMLRNSTETADFAPYSNICPISGHTQVDVDVSDGDTTQEQVTVNLGGTYYSGTLDVVTGVFTPDTAFKTFDGSEGWSANGTTGYLITRGASGMSDVKLASSANTYCLSNLIPRSGVTWADKSIGIENGTVWIGDVDNAVFGDLAGFKTFLSNTNLQLEYELATPTPIQLSPTMVKALVGENHLSAPLEGQEITESKYKQMFTFDDVNTQIESTYSEGISHNSVYRGKYLGDHVTDEQWDAIGDGSFRDLYIGDYWAINGINWRIAHFNYWLGTGDVKCNTNHVVIVPYGWVSTFNMNATDDTTGGYLNSEWYTTNRHFAVENIEADFGASHILSHRNFFSDAVSDGHASHGMWVDSTVDLMNEIMVCGSLVGSYSGKYYEVGCDKFQLALFKYNPPSTRMDVSYWLRGVSTASSFVAMGNFGLLDGFTASQILKIRPVFAIKK